MNCALYTNFPVNISVQQIKNFLLNYAHCPKLFTFLVTICNNLDRFTNYDHVCLVSSYGGR